MTSIRRNFFALIGQLVPSQGKDIKYIPLYEASALEGLRTEFLSVMSTDPAEEAIQKFIENNPILLHQFPAERIFYKPPILTHFKADFAIVTPQKELILIEIEPVTTKLLTKRGGQAAPLRRAFDQVHSWLHVIDEHRIAVLDSLNIPRDAVGKVRGVVVAGRDAGNDASHLRRLKGLDQGPVAFLTYDDLASGLAALVQRMNAL